MTAGLSSSSRRAGVAIDRVQREKDDYYSTPRNATEALLAKEKFTGPIWEPACGEGAISSVLQEHGYDVVSTDLVNRGFGSYGIDFLMEWKPHAPNIVTNPPFKLTEQFLRKSLELATGKVAIIGRLAWLAGQERGEIYAANPPARVWVFSKRVMMLRGGDASLEGSSMVDYAWLVWDASHEGPTQLGWL